MFFPLIHFKITMINCTISFFWLKDTETMIQWFEPFSFEFIDIPSAISQLTHYLNTLWLFKTFYDILDLATSWKSFSKFVWWVFPWLRCQHFGNYELEGGSSACLLQLLQKDTLQAQQACWYEWLLDLSAQGLIFFLAFHLHYFISWILGFRLTHPSVS